MRSLPRSLQALVLLLLTTSVTALENDFSSYPSGSQACLTKEADASGCTGDTGTEINECLCKNGGNFIYNTASCVAEESPSDLSTVYATLEANCAGTGVTISVSEAAFLAQASAATSSTTASATASQTSSSSTSSSTTSSAASSTSTADAGLSTGAKAGIGAGIGIAAVGLGLIGVFIWWYRRRNNRKDSKAAGDNSGTYAAASTAAPSEYTSAYGGQYPHSQYTHPSPHPESAIPLSATSGWNSPPPSATSGMYYKPQDAQIPGTAASGQQPLLLAELHSEGVTQQTAPVEMYAPHEGTMSSTLSPNTAAAGVYGRSASPLSYSAELPGTSSTTPEPERYQSPPGTHSPYSPPYERSHF
ncbi:hypothetical protein E8E14_013138 [Neopestalotiopsis sp. 37M]|nr:hypothetical protein E8E14_013138 [Neopestalotiopsis sp. 37M]